MVLNSGVLLYPLLFGMAKPFKQGKIIEKIGILWGALFPSMLFIVLGPLMFQENIYVKHTDEEILAAVYLFITLLLGGVFIYYIETASDRMRIKEQMKGISEKFQWESEKLQEITNVVPLSIMTLDSKGEIIEVNGLMLELLERHFPHLSKGELIDRSLNEFVARNGEDSSFLKLKDSIHNRRRCNENIYYNFRTYNVAVIPLEEGESGFSGGTMLVVQDITEEEKMRSEMVNVERLTLVGQMAAGITHEIRNPMAVVRGFLQLMREKSSEDLDSYYQIVMEELDRANSIIDDFLSLAQTRVSNKETVQLHSILQELSPLLWADANLRGQSVNMELSPSLPLLQLNVREIKQLILNLARNGMEAMDAKGVLTIKTNRTEDRVEMMIRDTGGGIPECQRTNLFIPFFTTKSQGTGLGLPLCLSIVERHQGTIAVDSTEGVGTEFTVSFPYKEEESVSATLSQV